MARILIIDDEENIRKSLKAALERRGHEVVTAESMAKGASYVSAGFDIILLDIILGDGNGMDLLKSIVSENKNQPVVMISGQTDIQTAIDAIKLGALDYIEKPVSLERLVVIIDKISQTSNLLLENQRLHGTLYGEMIGESDAITILKKSIKLSADKTSRFLIYGENGTGKELVAYMIHQYSKFPNGSFVPVNCAALPANLVESELFGHTSTAFTGAKKKRKGKFLEANNGTIFLDEIGEMSLESQAKILRVIENKKITPVGSDTEKEIECNIIAATNKNLETMVKDKTFREDLLYRLNVVQYNLPPLRERIDDIPLLIQFFLERFSLETKAETKQVSSSGLNFLKKYSFPGNIRELKNIVERLNIYCPQKVIETKDIKEHCPNIVSKEISPKEYKLKMAQDNFEKKFLLAAIERNKGNMTKTSAQLGLERSHLYKKMKKHKISSK